jgi:hypothetical protein
MSVVVSSGGNSMCGYGGYMYVANGENISRYNATSWALDTWSASLTYGNVVQMAISGGYMYVVTGDRDQSHVFRITLDNPSEQIEWCDCMWPYLTGVAISGNYVYVASADGSNSNGETKVFYKIDIETATMSPITTGAFNVPTFGITIDEDGKYLYASNNTGLSRLNLLDNGFEPFWWYDSTMPYTNSVAVWGEYAYVNALGSEQVYSAFKPMHTKRILLSNPYNIDNLDQLNDVLSLTVYNKLLYESTMNSIVQFHIAQPPSTVFYSNAKLTASMTETAMGNRGMASLFRQGQKKPVGVIEVITRSTPARFRRQTVHTTHLGCTITLFETHSVVSSRFVYASVGTNAIPGAITSVADVTSGIYSTAKVTMTPKGRLMEVKLEHPR